MSLPADIEDIPLVDDGDENTISNDELEAIAKTQQSNPNADHHTTKPDAPKLDENNNADKIGRNKKSDDTNNRDTDNTTESNDAKMSSKAAERVREVDERIMESARRLPKLAAPLPDTKTTPRTYGCFSKDETEDPAEKCRLIAAVLELQNTLDDLSCRVDLVKEESLQLRSENTVLGQYIQAIMAQSKMFKPTSTQRINQE